MKQVLLFLILLFLTTQIKAQNRYWVHKPYYENFFSSASELAEWGIVEDNGTGDWALTGLGTALLTMDDAAGSFANRMFNVNGGSPNFLPLDRTNGRVEIFVKSISGGNQRIFVQVQEFDASNVYLGEFSLLPGQSAIGFFSINFDAYSWNPAADKIRLIIGGENYSGQQGTVEFDYFSYSNNNGDWSNTANWSLTSNGVGGASAPTATEFAIFDGAGGNNGSCLLSANADVSGIQMTSAFTGNLDLQAFQITAGSAGVSISGGGVTGDNAVVIVNGNLSISGGAFNNTNGTNYAAGDISITGGVLDFSTGEVVFNGTTNQQFNSTMTNPIFKLDVNKPTGKVIFSSDILISGTLLLTEGVLQTNGNTVRLGLSTSQSGDLTLGNGKINGFFKRWINTGSSGNLVFPLGNDTVSAPVTLAINSPCSVGGSITAIYLDAFPAFNVVSFMDGSATIIGRSTSKWNLVTNGIVGGDYSLSAMNDNLATFLDLNELHLTLFNSVVGTNDAATGTISNPILHRSDLVDSELSQDWYASIAAPSALPINWGEFTAHETNLGIVIDWSTLQEENLERFIVQHSVDAVNFKDLISVKANGFSNITSYYTFIDKNFEIGKVNYYRLKQLDRDGKFSYSTIISVNSEQLHNRKLSIVGQVKEQLTIKCFVDGIEVDIMDNTGHHILNQKLASGINSINCSQWSSGVFFITVFENGHFLESIRFIKQP